MSNNQGRRRQEQTVPLIFERVRSRVTREVSMPAKTGEDLDRYIEWACEEVGAVPDEAMCLVMEHALGQFFQRDKLFQDARRAREDADRSKESARPAAPATPAPSSTPAAGPAKGAPPSQPSNTRPAVAQ